MSNRWQAERNAFFDRTGYLLPDHLASSEDCDRLFHHDLEVMTDRELGAEETLVSLAMAHAVKMGGGPWVSFPGSPHHRRSAADWLEQRLARVREEIARRRRLR